MALQHHFVVVYDDILGWRTDDETANFPGGVIYDDENDNWGSVQAFGVEGKDADIYGKLLSILRQANEE